MLRSDIGVPRLKYRLGRPIHLSGKFYPQLKPCLVGDQEIDYTLRLAEFYADVSHQMEHGLSLSKLLMTSTHCKHAASREQTPSSWPIILPITYGVMTELLPFSGTRHPTPNQPSSSAEAMQKLNTKAKDTKRATSLDRNGLFSCMWEASSQK